MNAPHDRTQRARALCDRALAMPTRQRDDFVRTEAGDDHGLAAAALELLRQTPAGAPERIGPYRILEQLGEGGMGVVYLAEQKEPIRRRVAIKLIKRGMDSKTVLARFEAERRALSMMEHSCIATVLDGGASDQGQPYFVMEYVKGIPITVYCDQNKLSLRDRIELFQRVCSGVQHAHMKGVMHRDLKPGNVLVTLQDGQPIPKIIDFGLAKATDHHLVEQTIYTEHGVLLGTPEYMSPEQAGLGGLDVDTRTDVYSLGVLLHELLVGELPFSRAELRGAGMIEMQRVIREQEPAKPSTKITTLGDAAGVNAAARRMQTGELQRSLRGELDWIVLKAIEKDRTRRYQTAQELAADLERYLNDEPVLAGPPTASYVLKKLYRRYRVPMLAAAGMVVALAAGLVIAVWQANVAAAAQREATRLKDVAESSLANFRRLKDQVRVDEFVARERQLTETAADLPTMRVWLAECNAWIGGLDDHAGALAALAREGKQPDGTVAFADDAKSFLYVTLKKLCADLDALRRQGGTLDRVRAATERVATLHRRTVDDRISDWNDVVAWVGAAAQFGLRDFVPQDGLIPLGRDPVSGLPEFLFERSGDAPTGAPGAWHLTGATGIVLVLVPGGTTRIGTDAAVANDGERGTFEVTLAPYFVSKYETTQAQWERLTGTNPSYFHSRRTGFDTSLQPVESVTWLEAAECARRFGLQLPTEAQWEHACRAGTRTAWHFGDSRDDLLSDDDMGRFNAAEGDASNIEDSAFWPDYRDGHQITAPVSEFQPNGHGLHNMHGNVAELTRDAFLSYARFAEAKARFVPGSGEITWDAPSDLVGHRGGSWFKRVEAARSFSRKGIARDARFHNIGVRFVRELQR